MTLSTKSMRKIADALAVDIAADLINSDTWLDFLHTEVGGLIVDKLGQIDDEVLAELIMMISENLYVESYETRN